MCFDGGPDNIVQQCRGKLFVAVIAKDANPLGRSIKVEAENSSGEKCVKVARFTGTYTKTSPTVAYFGAVPTGTYKVRLLDDEFIAEQAGVEVSPQKKVSRENPNVKLQVTEKPRAHLVFKFKDPEDKSREFPKDFPVTICLNATKDALAGEEQLAGKISDKGILFGPDDEEGFEYDPSKHKTFSLEFPTDKGAYVVCEKQGAALAQEYIATDEAPPKKDSVLDKKLKKGGRSFRFPLDKWNLKTSDWEIDSDKYKKTDYVFEGLDESKEQSIAPKDAPIELLLKPAWQFTKFTYWDRSINYDSSKQQITVLPLAICGFMGSPGDSPASADIDTCSNWIMGDDEKSVTQCIPWILINPDEDPQTKPNKESELRFYSEEHTFIHTKSDGSRELSIGEQKVASVARLDYYDLPKEWRSKNYFVRDNIDTTNVNTGKFFWELDSREKVLGSKDKPLIFSLDDIVLYSASNTGVLSPAVSLPISQGIAIFSHTFSDNGDNTKFSPEGIYLPKADVDYHPDDAVNSANSPASADGKVTADFAVNGLENQFSDAINNSIFARAKGGAVAGTKADKVRDELHENYIFNYPNWIRLLIAGGNLFDVFSERSIAKNGENRVVGARAAVCWYDTSGLPAAGDGRASEHALKEKDFFALQPHFGIEAVSGNVRMDKASSSTKGSASSDTTIAALKHSRVGRAVEKHREHAPSPPDSTATPNPRIIGRYDICNIRCAGKDNDDDKKESIIALQYFALNSQVQTGSTLTTQAKIKKWIKDLVPAANKRWNGADGAYNAGRVSIEATADDKSFKAQHIRICQINSKGSANYRIQIVPAGSGRDYHDSSGIIQASKGNEVPKPDGDFITGHELGHGGGLLDDYCELWNHNSLYQPGVGMLVPGDPYRYDDVSGSESIMLGDKVVRPRHFWHIAEWLRPQLGVDLQLLAANGGDPYKLLHHPRNTKVDKFRTYLSTPFASNLDTALKIGGVDRLAQFDAYFFPQGKDEYSKNIMPGKCGDNTAIDSLLLIVVNMGVYFPSSDFDKARAAAAKIMANLDSTYNYRHHAKLKVSGQEFNRCLIHITPRILLGSYADNMSYLKKMKCWELQVGGWVKIQIADGDADNVKRIKFDKIVKDKAEKNQLHVVTKIDGIRAEVNYQANKLPVIQTKAADIKVEDALVEMLDLFTAVIKKYLADIRAKGAVVAQLSQQAKQKEQDWKQEKLVGDADSILLAKMEYDIKKEEHDLEKAVYDRWIAEYVPYEPENKFISIVQKTKEMADELFQNANRISNDPLYKSLRGQMIVDLKTARSTRNPFKLISKKWKESKTSGAAADKVKETVDILPNYAAEEGLLLDLVNAQIEVANKMKEAAESGANRTEKEQKIQLCRTYLTEAKQQIQQLVNQEFAKWGPKYSNDERSHYVTLLEVKSKYQPNRGLEKSIKELFGEYLNIKMDKTDNSGYKELVKSVADSTEEPTVSNF